MTSTRRPSAEGIAIIGLAGRFPGARNIDAFWGNLINGVESISTFTDAELRTSGVAPSLLRDPGYVKARALLEDADLFDAGFFGYTPADAASMDPQQRIFLECTWAALEHAGYDPERCAGAIGLFAGHGLNTYLLANLCAGREWIDEFLDGRNVGSFQTFLGNDKDYLTSRVAFKLNLRGPAVTVQTACSTSLVAVAMACQSLLTHQSDMALAGGVSVTFPQRKGYLHREGGITSPDGHCRAFDARAQGTVFGSGAGVVVLKRVADALADGDQIYAVIRGSALNNDGALKVSYTAPSVDGQAEVIVMAQTLAGVSPDTISYIETHGTGTLLGDPVEVAALTQAFRLGTDRRQFCAIGSVKTNIGHLDAAAGIAGLIKTVLALHHRKIPPSLHCNQPNPQIDFAGSPFFVATSAADWPTNPGAPRRAGVSSFGVGGTNAHVVLEEAPAAASNPTGKIPPAHLLLLSARNEMALDQAATNLRDHLRAHPEVNLADVAYTLQIGRRAFSCRRAVVCRDIADAIATLSSVRNDAPVVTTASDETAAALIALGQRWVAGEEQDGAAFQARGQRRRVPLPTYPFKRERHFVDPPRSHFENAPRDRDPEGASDIATDSPRASGTTRPTPNSVVPVSPVDRIAADLITLFRELSGVDLNPTHRAVPLIELGFDSLFLTQVRQSFETEFGVNVTYRQLAEGLNTIDALAAHLAAHAAVATIPTAQTRSSPPSQPSEESTNGNSREAATPAAAPLAAPFQTKAAGPFHPLTKTRSDSLTTRQQTWLAEFTARYTRRTAISKRIATENRRGVADPRSLANYRPLWKELVYQIVVDESAGARLRDVDGNDYLDVTMGFGANLFGHSPAFVTEAVSDQLRKGVHIGPQSPLTGEVAALIREFTGLERVTFCNTGSEAVMAALRIARTVTKRTKVVYFSGDYHGLFDEVLMRPDRNAGAATRPLPVAPGIPLNAGAEVVVLDYGAPASLEVIRQLGSELAAVLVEPVQSRNPALQPREFLHALRRITRANGAVLIFDEVITGFRVHPGGAQAWFGVPADLATYGKVIGGGLPFGVVAGSARCMDALDGGAWNFGDDSGPEADITFFAGTFVRHPLALAAARASLLHLKQQGPELQTALNRRATRLAEELNAFFVEEALAIRVAHFGSLFRFAFPPELPHATLLVYLLLERGIYFRDAHQNCFLSTAHTDQDVDRFIAAVKAGVRELQDADFLPRRDRAAPFALTDAQQEIWLACQWNADLSRAYNQSVALELRGPLDFAALQAAWTELWARHEALRLTIAADGETQHAMPPHAATLPLVDWSALGATDRAAKVAGIAAEEATRIFDLENGPLVRVRACRLAPDVHRFVFTAHHLVCDGWSVGVLFDELGRLYAAKRNRAGVMSPPLEPANTFREFARDRAARQTSAGFVAAEAYWLARFASPPAALELPLDHPRGPATGNHGGSERVRLAPALQRELKELGARQGATLFATLLAGFKVLLRRLSGQDETVVGIFTAGRAHAGAGALVGHCVNLLPIRSDAADDVEFGRFVTEVNGLVLDARDHEDHAYGRLVQKLKLAREPGRPPLIGALFNLEPGGDTGLDFAGLAVELDLNAKGFVNFELFLNIRESAGGLTLDLAYNRGLFEPASMRRWLGHYETLLAAVVAQPTLAIYAVPLLDVGQWRQQIIAWNGTAAEFPRAAGLHELFAAAARTHPAAPAVTEGAHTITYRELDERASQLAARLCALDVRAETRVALCLDRSLDLIVGILGTLKAGGAYVPLDPAYPPERLAFMLQDSGAAVLLTQRSARAKLPAPTAHVICLDEVERHGPDALSPADRQTSARRATRSTPHGATLAYIIYTSGSTGQPKGVMIEHRAIVNHLTWRQRTFPLGAGDSFLQKASSSFDISVWEIFAPLIAGARLVLARAGGQGDAAYLAKLIATERITDVHFGPAMLRLTLDEPAFERGASLRRVFCGGEPLSAELQAHFHAHCDAALISQYGPTETTVDATWFPCERAAADVTAPIGRPIANTQAYLLDRRLQPVPVGVAGELCLAGESLARGYLNQPALTAEKFVRHPFSDDPAARLYRTGDRCRRRPDGVIEFLGRLDAQLKIRGFRIEPGEIEAALSSHAAAREVLVTAREDSPGDQRLVAYIVPAGAPVSTPEAERDLVTALRSFLATRLPAYMVPEFFVVLAALPRLPNGKVDANTLPAPAVVRSISGNIAAPPVTAAEKILAAIWRDVLRVPSVGPADNFFALGGHSLLAIRVVARVREAFHVELPMRHVFETTNLAALAGLIEDQLLAQIDALADAKALRDSAAIAVK